MSLPECFVIMPISDPEGYPPGHFRRVFDDLFVPACERAGYRAVRGDEMKQTHLIHLDVLQRLLDSPMALCDLSSRNPNVLFELGLRQAFDKPVVLAQERGTPPIFDIGPLRYTDYGREMSYRQVIEDQASLAEAITATKDATGNAMNVNSIVRLLSLTHAAALPSAPEGDQTAQLLRVVMAELENIKSDIAALRNPSRRSQLFGGGYPEKDGLKAYAEELSAIDGILKRIKEHGFVAGLAAGLMLQKKQVREAFAKSDTLLDFMWACQHLLVPNSDHTILHRMLAINQTRTELEQSFREEKLQAEEGGQRGVQI